MNCEFCKKNIQNLIDNTLTKEQKLEMTDHIKNCDSCRKKYNYEKKIHDDFKSVLHDYDPGFVSSRKMIMSKIDKKKYPLSFSERTGYKMKRNKGIVAAAAVIIIAVSSGVIFIPKLMNAGNTEGVKVSVQASNENKKKTSPDDSKTVDKNKVLESAENTEIKQEDNKKSETQKGAEDIDALTIFSKDVPSDATIKTMNKESQTPWEYNEENKCSACVLGKGPYAEEEGYASLMVKNAKGSLTEYKLKNERDSQDTIVQTEWLDKDRILVMTGSAYGTLVSGKNIYSININNGVTKLAFDTASKTQRIKKMKSKGDGYIEITLAQYTDDALNNSMEIIKTIRI